MSGAYQLTDAVMREESAHSEETLRPQTFTTYATIVDTTQPVREVKEHQQWMEKSARDWQQEQAEWRQKQEEQWQRQQEEHQKMQQKMEEMQQQLEQKDSLNPSQGFQGSPPEVNLANVPHAKTVITAAIEDFSPVWWVLAL